jgi:hypothetical protein
MVVNPSVPANTVPQFIAYAKANPGKISFGSSDIGSGNDLAGVDMVHVPYRSGLDHYAPNRRDTGSTTARSVDEVALFRDTKPLCACVDRTPGRSRSLNFFDLTIGEDRCNFQKMTVVLTA